MNGRRARVIPYCVGPLTCVSGLLMAQQNGKMWPALFFLKVYVKDQQELSLIFSTCSKATTVGSKRLLSVLFSGSLTTPKSSILLFRRVFQRIQFFF
jgi:hypothetical protein